MRIKFNAPVILAFTFICTVVLIIDSYFLPGFSRQWFTVSGKGHFSSSNAAHWLSLFTHIIGHSSWTHLISNFSMILLLGPMLEDRYGSLPLLVMIVITTLVTGVLNVIFFSTGLMGASGVVFMMILLASFTNYTQGEIPVTFILVLVLYLGEQIQKSGDGGSISRFAHIAGGFCGSLFGLVFPPKRR